MMSVSLPATVAALDPDGKAASLSTIMGLYAVVGIFAAPIAGILSDRCASRLGMRRPFLLIGGAIGVIAMMTMAVSTSIVVFTLGALIAALGAGIYAGGNMALVPDQVSERSRGRIMGILAVMNGLAGFAASIVLPAFLSSQFLLFALPGGFLAIATIVVTVMIKDRRLAPGERVTDSSIRGFFAQFKVNPLAIPDYSWAWIGKVIVTLGTVLTSLYGFYFLTDVLAVTPETLPGVLTISGIMSVATGILGAAVGSWISDRFKVRKSLVLYAVLVIAAGSIIVAFAPNVTVYLIGVAIMGIGTGAYFPIDGALMIDVLPGEGKESGKYMGFMSLADSLPRSFGPFIAAGVLALGALIPLGGYPLVYLVGAAIAIVGGLLVRKIKGSH